MSGARYFDNAATSFPKPPGVAQAIAHYLTAVGGSYGRSAYPRAVEVARTVERTRDRLAALLGTAYAEHVVFMPNATTAINTVLQGLSYKGGCVLISPLEHNAVMRPLVAIGKREPLQIKILPHLPDGTVDVEHLRGQLQADVRLAVVNHVSNVNGVVQPLLEIRQALGKIPLLVDASQSLGAIPICADEWQLDYVAFTGHKSLLGPTGTGGLFIRQPESILPLVLGGTGNVSHGYVMPETGPERFEAGTINSVGIFGLFAALEQRPDPCHLPTDFTGLMESLRKIPGIRVHGAANTDCQAELISIEVLNHDPAEFGGALSNRFGIDVRVGLHCAPLAHQTLGTFPRGTIRIAASVYHTRDDFAYLYNSICEIMA